MTMLYNHQSHLVARVKVATKSKHPAIIWDNMVLYHRAWNKNKKFVSHSLKAGAFYRLSLASPSKMCKLFILSLMYQELFKK